MRRADLQRIVIIGAGNLAWHLAVKLSSTKKFRITVCNHKASPKLQRFKKLVNCEVQTGLGKIGKFEDYYLLCVKDEAIRVVSTGLKRLQPSAVVVHCSGSKDLNETLSSHLNRAVLYPLQTFSAGDNINWDETPVLIEGNSRHSLQRTKGLANYLSGKVVIKNSSERQKMHLAAVLVNNFPNALYTAAFGLLEETGRASDFRLFLPLIRQGVDKLERMNPRQAQTGPAKRGDKKVMQQHLKLLTGHPELRDVYLLLSALIARQSK